MFVSDRRLSGDTSKKEATHGCALVHLCATIALLLDLKLFVMVSVRLLAFLMEVSFRQSRRFLD